MYTILEFAALHYFLLVCIICVQLQDQVRDLKEKNVASQETSRKADAELVQVYNAFPY